MAVTVVDAARVTVQLPVPLQPPPLQPVNVEPVDGTAPSVIVLPALNGAVQVAPQAMPAGVEVTVPAPLPALLTDSATWLTVKLAPTVRAWSIVTTQAPTPVQAPVHPVNAEVPPAVAVSATIVPWS